MLIAIVSKVLIVATISLILHVLVPVGPLRTSDLSDVSLPLAPSSIQWQPSDYQVQAASSL